MIEPSRPRRLGPLGRREDDELSEVLGQAADGDGEAFTAIYAALVPAVSRLVIGVVRDAAQAEEVTQEVFLEVWQGAARFDRRAGSVRAWVMTIARRRAIDRVRWSQASRERDQRGSALELDVDGEDVVAEAALSRVVGREVLAALAALSREHRQALTLAYLEGLTHREVARVVGVPEGTAKTRVRDGLANLRRRFHIGPPRAPGDTAVFDRSPRRVSSAPGPRVTGASSRFIQSVGPAASKRP